MKRLYITNVLIKLIFISVPVCVHAGSISKNNTFTPGTVISSSQINSNFDQLFIELNAKETRLSTLESGGGSLWSANGSSLYYNAGSVGIGTATPGALLEIFGNNTGGADIITALKLNRSYFDVGDQMNLDFGDSSANGIARIAAVARAGGEGAITFSSQTGAGSGLTNEVMRIQGNGNVGIGTTSPNYPLEINGNTNSIHYVQVFNSSAGASAGSALMLGENGDSTLVKIQVNGTANASLGGAQSLNFLNNGTVTTFNYGGTTEVMRLSSGNVGIGDVSPDTTLKVVGAICAKSDGNNCAGNVAGTIYANNTTVQNADYAEYFFAEEKLKKGDIVGLNSASGFARGYRAGDKLLGIVSTTPGIVGNSGIKDKNSVLVAIMGQVPLNRKQVKINGNTVKTLDGVSVGYLLANRNVFININSSDHDREIVKLRSENESIKNENSTIKEYLCSKDPSASLCKNLAKNIFKH